MPADADARRRREWPGSGLDVGALRAAGAAAVPLRQVVLKIAARCDLDCSYCYVYSLRDSGWRDRPRLMAPSTVRATAARIREHALAHRLPEVSVVFHGGEPLLAGVEAITEACGAMRSVVGEATTLAFALQTNGVRLDEAMLIAAEREGISISVSMDGTRESHDRFRVHRDGRGSFDRVDAALRLLSSRKYRHLFGGLLAVVDIDADPVRAYEALMRYQPPIIDFLLPFANWTFPPRQPRRPGSTTPYGDWLTALLEHWYAAPRPRTTVRILEEALQLMLGGIGGTEVIGLAPATSVVVETNGSIEQAGGLRAAYDGASATDYTVFDSSFDDLLETPEFAARQGGAAVLAAECRSCEWLTVCGGGHYAHRYTAGDGFLRQSVYCSDLKALFARMAVLISGDLRATAS